VWCKRCDADRLAKLLGQFEELVRQHQS
jgi:hypothetical protein